MHKASRWLAVLAVVMLIEGVMIASGCGSTTTTTTAGPATTTAPPTTTAAPADTTTTAATAAAYDIKTVLAGVTADPALTAMLPANIVSAGEMKVASDIPYPPWEMFVGDTKQATGFDYDLSQAIAAKLGIKAAFIETKFESIILTLQSKKNDTAMSDMYDNLERRKVVDFVDYAFDGTGILVLKGNPKKIANLDSLAGQAVGVEKGTTQAVMLEELNESFKTAGKPEITIMQYPDQPAALLAVQSGKVVADLTDYSTAAYVAQTTENGSVFEVVVDPAAPTGYEGQPIGALFLKENTQLRDAFQKALQALIDDGTYQTIIGHYGLLPVESAQINQGTASGT